jgi:N6-adenosine-specific RNA methylase IME4
MSSWPFGVIRPFSQRVIYADPNWSFDNYSAAGELKNPKAHYHCDSTEDIAALPVGHLAHADGAALVMWATFPMLPQALYVMGKLGFTFKTGGPWMKQSKTGQKWQFGPGYIFRSAAELFLVGKMGAPKGRDSSEARSVRNLIAGDDWLGAIEFAMAAPVREHSRKPDIMIDMIEALFDGPYVELFARQSRPGWSSWGNESTKFDGAVPS